MVWALLFLPLTNDKSLSNLAIEPFLIWILMLCGAGIRFAIWRDRALTNRQAAALGTSLAIAAAVLSVFMPVLPE